MAANKLPQRPTPIASMSGVARIPKGTRVYLVAEDELEPAPTPADIEKEAAEKASAEVRALAEDRAAAHKALDEAIDRAAQWVKVKPARALELVVENDCEFVTLLNLRSCIVAQNAGYIEKFNRELQKKVKKH